MGKLYERIQKKLKKSKDELFLFPDTYQYNQILERLKEEGYTTKISEVEGTCIIFDCKQLSHIVSRGGEKEEIDVNETIGLVVGFILNHPELTDVSVGPCTTRHKDKKNMARVSLDGYFEHWYQKECDCECGCHLLPGKANHSLLVGNSWDDTEAIFECHRFQKKRKDRIVHISKP
ncbi:hypothetical protein PMV_048 [Port-miou virus]|uniref:Uncharacterized protein n=1 Tax=Port-miou virus TaxID=1733873 RepID=A0A0N9Q0N8_9VIRU|nr:hypothetical protein PMV_048 [Port-miou virus]